MLANRLKILLAERDLSIKEIIQKTGISRNVLSNMINKPYTNVSTTNLDKLCNFLEITPEDFFDYYPLRISYAHIPSKLKDKDVMLLAMTTTSGTVINKFSLVLEADNNNVKSKSEGYNLLINVWYNPEEMFYKIYSEVTPFFKHQIEKEIIRAAKQYLKDINSKKDEFSIIDNPYYSVAIEVKPKDSEDNPKPIFMSALEGLETRI